MVTDLDTRHLEALADPRLDVQCHDIGSSPLPESAFDLIHARLVINHLADRDTVLRRMAGALAPSGWLLLEEFDSDSAPPDPLANPGETYLETHQALARLMADRGFDRRIGRQLFRMMRECGLAEVSAEARTFMCPGGSPGTRLIQANLQQLRGALLDGGYITARQFDEDLTALDRPDFLMPSSSLWTARGRRDSTPSLNG